MPHEMKGLHFSFQTSRTALQEAVHREYTEIVTMLIKAQSAADERVRTGKITAFSNSLSKSLE